MLQRIKYVEFNENVHNRDFLCEAMDWLKYIILTVLAIRKFTALMNYYESRDGDGKNSIILLPHPLLR